MPPLGKLNVDFFNEVFVFDGIFLVAILVQNLGPKLVQRQPSVCLSGGGGAKTPTLDPVCIRETPEKMIVWSLPPQMKNPRYGPVDINLQ